MNTTTSPSTLATSRPLFSELNLFIHTYRGGIILSFLFLLLGYGMKMFSNTYSVDTQAIIDVPNSQYNAWLTLDRFGLVALKKALGLYWYNNSLASILTPLLFFIAIWLWAFFLHRTWTFYFHFRPLAFTLPALSAPIFAEQLGFLLQGIEITLCLNAVVLASILLFESAHQKRSTRILYTLTAVALCTLAFSCYLAMTTVFVLVVASGLFCSSARRESRHLLFFFTSITTFALSFILFKVLNKLVLSYLHLRTHTYINDQSRWGKDPLQTIAANIARRGYHMLAGDNIFYTGFLSFVLTLFLGIIIYGIRKKHFTWVTGVIGLCICAAPLLMTVILGGPTTYRTELTFPLALAIMVAIIASRAHYRKLVGIPAWVLVLAISAQGIYNVNRLYYTEATIYQQDVTLANTIYERAITQKADTDSSLRIVFIGSHAQEGNKSTFPREKLELIGVSIFSISFSTSHSTFNMVQFMHNQGIPIKSPTSDDIALAERQASNMPHWPATGSVQVHGDVAVVNF